MSETVQDLPRKPYSPGRLPHAAARLLLCGLAAVLVAVPASAGTVSYTYDALGRVKTATYSNGTVITYAYDAAGNRTSQVTTGAP